MTTTYVIASVCNSHLNACVRINHTSSIVSPLRSLLDPGSDVDIAEVCYISRKNEERIQGERSVYSYIVNYTSVRIGLLSSIVNVVSEMAVFGSVALVVDLSLSSSL